MCTILVPVHILSTDVTFNLTSFQQKSRECAAAPVLKCNLWLLTHSQVKHDFLISIPEEERKYKYT